jgi:hypothetical protein
MEHTFAERWDGSSWQIQTTPDPTDAQASFLASVSCSSASACTAVGGYVDGSGIHVTLAERWNGSGWVIQMTPNPGSQFSLLSGVSCSSASACTAVGDYIDGSGTQVTFAERWDGTTWAIQTTPNPTAARKGSELLGVSCSSASACTAVGNYQDSIRAGLAFAERWNGTSWAIRTTPNPIGERSSGLSGVSCGSASACTAVGTYAFASSLFDGASLVEAWDGSSWQIQTSPKPNGAQASLLAGVSCSSASACTAVGNYTDSSGTRMMLAERWDGTSWKIQKSPNPAGARSSQLSGVSCSSASACTAVGNYTNSSGTQVTLAEQWNGSGWAIQTTPNPGSLYSRLLGVSCSSANACTAVGADSSGTQVTLAERWDGSSWAVQTTPIPTGVQRSELAGVSCGSANVCTAVGDSTTTGPFATLAEQWDGSSWQVQSTPNPGSQVNLLSAVSCSSAGDCTAVGEDSSGTPVTLAERWNGSNWAVQKTPNPTGAQSSALAGVSCSSASACTAIGSYTNGSGTRLTLAERVVPPAGSSSARSPR